MESTLPVFELVIVVVSLACGGILKGATGAGAPLLAVPALVAFHDVRFAIVIMTVPNLITNAMQMWQNRQHHLRANFLVPFLLSAAIGVTLGTWALVGLDSRTLSLVVALAVVLYLVLRLTKSNWRLSAPLALRLAAVFGFISGVVQGSAGISAPVSLSFLNAMGLDRQSFMNTTSMLFVTFASVQLPALAFTGVLTPLGFLLSCVALLPMLMGMSFGTFIARKISREVFDRLVMLLLAGLAAKMLWEALIPAG
ncbi:sulfite exporter TauE/SafE family protein [Devosia ginsengisoli]|uniref:Probable membrane transporter protein n=1 Tax=Devosia ginsengisoli TaxID=400770 RepID=A0A5B8LTU8_9HYPH|nr:sulfite exporter TauE/SafE family protein [Devosia ginsengisoli]